MVIFLSGPYGVGKSTVAAILKERLNALVFDAEAVGNAVRDNYPDWPFGAVFEDYPLWAETCTALLKDLHSRYDRPILVPITLMRAVSRTALVDRLEGLGVPTRLVVLTATSGTVHDRILARGEGEDCWCMRHIGESLRGALSLGGVPVDTEGRTPEQVARAVEDVIRV